MSHKHVKRSKTGGATTVRRAVALILAGTAVARGATLPVPCPPSACNGGKVPGWAMTNTATGLTLNNGAASYVQSGNSAKVTQNASSVVLNWQSFNISPDGTVTFVQPSNSAVALNRVFDVNPSTINGVLKANGQVYILNQNGVIFGSNAQVNVGGLLASSLNISTAALNNGIASAAASGSDALDSTGLTGPIGPVIVSKGAQIVTDQGGNVYLFAPPQTSGQPSVENDGSIQTPSGQTILGAGQRIFLVPSTATSSADASQVRGLIIEVGDNGGPGGTVTNTGTILSTAGNVTLAGLAVRQDGRVSATTTVRSNGSILLQARDTSATSTPDPTSVSVLADHTGTVTLGAGSETDISLQGTDKTVDANAQPKSYIHLYGGSVQVLDNASIIAPSGTVTLDAVGTPDFSRTGVTGSGTKPDQARIWLAPTSTIDVSGANISLPMDSNSLSVQLRGVETADFPQQQQGKSPIYGETLYVDARQYGKRADGSPWVGSPIADLSGYLEAVQRDVSERNLTGGTVNLNSTGSVIVSKGATVNVSGGSIAYQSGFLQSSVLLGADGKAYPIASADPTMTYVGTVGTITQGDPHWGVSTTITLPFSSTAQGQYVQGYVEGKDAGTISIITSAAVLDGTFAAGVTVGVNQRLPPTPQSKWPLQTNQLYRPYDQVPVGGTLILGNPAANPTGGDQATRQVLQNVTFASGTVLDTLTGSNGKPFDPTKDALPSDFVTTVRPDMLGGAGFSNLNVNAEGNITVPAGITLSPGAGGSVTLSAGRIDLAGSIDAPGGTVKLIAAPTIAYPGGQGVQNANPKGGLPSLVLEKTASIDVSGEWINDNPAVSSDVLAPLFTSGGQVSLSSSFGSLLFPAGAVIDASGGAQYTASGSVVAGTGGSINIKASPGNNESVSQFAMDGLVEAYALDMGGLLNLGLPALCVSSLKCADNTALRIDPRIFTDFGFSSVTLGSTVGSLTIAADVDVAAKQKNYVLASDASMQPSARSLSGFSQLALLPDNLRSPESISLASFTDATTGATSVNYADLTIAQGARLAVDPGASIGLTSDSRIFANGTLIAPHGDVTLKLTPGLGSIVGYRADQGIWLGPNSLIDVSGVVEHTPNDANLDLGTVLAGGTINIQALTGYVYLAPGSSLNASGTSGTLDENSPGTSSYTRTVVASAGGTIDLTAAEGLQLAGTLTAAGGSGAAGGALSVSLDSSTLLTEGSKDHPATAPNLEIAATFSPIIVAEGSAAPDFLANQGTIAAATINNGGFDSVTLRARNLDLNNNGTKVTAIGAVSFDSGVSLHPASQLVIDTAQINASSKAGAVTLASDYVALGSTDASGANGQQVGTPTAASSSLNVSGHLVDLVGALEINNFGSASISSATDLRLVGVANTTSNNSAYYLGALTVPGSLTLSAQQIYPTTVTNYSINVIESGKQASTLTINGVTGQAGEVLSAEGNLSLQADNVMISGSLRAPMGTISVKGTDVTVDTGAVISVSTNGVTIPFGQTEGGQDWVYSYANLTQVYGTGSGQSLLPQKQVSFSSSHLNVESGATIDLSGGGDLEAYEWIQGVGGNANVLSYGRTATGFSRGTYAPNMFSIVPTASLAYAPIDPGLNSGFAQALAGAGFSETYGASIHLSAGSGVQAGTYTILPAIYATLIPGAYLVKPVSGYTNLAAGQAIRQLDGSTIVSGYRTYGSTGLGDTQTSGWDVIPVTYNQQQKAYTTYGQESAQYNITTANSFFTAQAQNANVAVPRLPDDAGALAINVTTTANTANASSLTLDGNLLTTTPSGGRGATVDIAGSNLIITSTTQDVPTTGSGWVALNPGQLEALGAESILIGGTRTGAVNATDLTVDASNVIVDQGVQLSGQEFIFAATQQLTIGANASITATGAKVANEAALLVPSGSAVVRVSTGSLTEVDQAKGSSGSATAPGSLTIASGAVISTPGSVSFDASGSVNFAGSLSAAGAAVRVGANQIAFGPVAQGFNGFAISDALLAGLANTDLTLNAYASASAPASQIQVNGTVDLTVNKLNIAAAGISLGSGAAFNVSAGDITLGNPTTGTASATSGTGTLQFSASHINLAAGTFTISGAASTTLSSGQDITATGTGTLSTSGDLHLASAVMQSAAGVDYNFTTPGTGTLTTALLGSASGTTAASGPGGSLSFSGGGVSLGGNIILPAGKISATATGPSSSGNVTVLDGTTLNVSGFSLTFAGETESAPGGTINLTSTSGNIVLAPTATLNVSAGSGQAAGGTLSLVAPQGEIQAPSGSAGLVAQLKGAGGTGQAGASITIDAQQFGTLTALAALSQTAGFTGDWNLHERGNGDLLLDSGTLRGTGVSLTTDGGAVDINGTIDVSGDLGGQILLAGNGITIGSTGVLLAGSTTRTDRGGTIDLFSGGRLAIDSGATLSVGGAGSTATGTVWLRAPAANVLSVLNGPGASTFNIAGNIAGAAHINVEGFTPFNLAGGSTINPDSQGSNGVSQYYAAAQTFYQAAMMGPTTVAQALGRDKDPTFTVLPGVEIDSSGDLTVQSSQGGIWDLSQWRFGQTTNSPGTPGVLTLRASGNLYVNSTISDGVTVVNNNPQNGLQDFPLDGAAAGSSWSYRFAAGADLASAANPLAVKNVTELGSGGNFVVGPGTSPVTNGGLTPVIGTQTAIRTGTGSIQIAAGGDVKLSNAASVIYTVGAAGNDPTFDVYGLPASSSNFQDLPYPTGGGSIRVSAGGDVVGAPSNQLFSDWLWRTGSGGSPTLPDGSANPNFVPVSWTAAIDFFNQGIGALGGGDVTVKAGGNIVDLGANVPSVGRPNAAGTTTEVDNGILRVIAGGNISGGKFLDMAGEAFIRAGGALTAGTPQDGESRGLYPVIAVGSGQFDVAARSNLTIETALNPTLLPESQFEILAIQSQQFFSTYSDLSRVSLASWGGDVTVNQAAGADSLLVSSSNTLAAGPTATLYWNLSGGNFALKTFTPTFSAVSFGGNVDVNGGMDLWPSAKGNLDLLAAGAVTFRPLSQVGFDLVMSDADPTQLPSVTNPLTTGSPDAVLLAIESSGNTGPEHASSPLHGGAYSQDQQPDVVPARIVALSGDVSYIQPPGNPGTPLLYIPKPVDIIAGRDISNLNLVVQQFAADNLSNIIAGRDIIYTSTFQTNGTLQPDNSGIEFDGPGRATISAGRNIDLGTSNGIVSVGNLFNTGLPQNDGTSLTVEAGVPANPNYQAFITNYLANSDTYDQQLIQYMESFDGTATALTKAQALAQFQALSPYDQTFVLESIFFKELTDSAKAAASTGATHDNYTQGFNALEALFKGSNPDLSKGQTNPYSGNIILDFSGIYTRQGGDINLLAPGGEIDVGLAVAPAAFGISKQASQLGVVAQGKGTVNMLSYGNINVNQSRVFAADGGDILMWSTEGNIDAGRGAKTSISAPPPTVTIDPKTGQAIVTFPVALQGSGIQALATSVGTSPGAVTLAAPHGVVNANDAGIVAGNLTIAATAILGQNNITFSGTAIGLPPPVIPLGAVTSAASSTGAAASAAGVSAATENAGQSKSPLATATLGWLDVFVLGLGEEQCKTDDLECLKRQKH